MTTAQAVTSATGRTYNCEALRSLGDSQGRQEADRIERCTKGSSVFMDSAKLCRGRCTFKLGDLLNVNNQKVCIIANDLFESGMPLRSEVSIWTPLKDDDGRYLELRASSYRYTLFKGRVYSKSNTGGEW